MTSVEPTAEDRPLRGRRRLPQILASAAAGFAEKGYDGASVADLTAWTGLGRGALYRQIGSKPDLLRAIAERYVFAVEEAVAGLDVDSDPAQLLRDWARTVFATQTELHDFARVFYNERRALQPAVGAELDGRLKAVGRPALDAIERMCPDAPDEVGQAFLGMVFASYLWFRPEHDTDLLADQTVALYLQGVRHPGPSARGGASKER
jgi:AcrR family transcriptional regulator